MIFELDFPAEPRSAQETQGPDNAQLVLRSLTADLGAAGEFSLAWSDAPVGTPLVRTQVIRPQTPDENAARDGGEVIDERDVELFGREGLEVTAFYEGLVGTLAMTPASASDQGDAASFIDSLRRSIGPSKTFADAVASDAPDARDLGRATHADTDLTMALADANGAGSCA